MNEGSFLGLFAAKFASEVLIVDSNSYFRMVLEKYKKHNKLSNLSILENLDELQSSPEIVLSEPFYFSSILISDNLRFWFDIEEIRKKFPDKEMEIYPKVNFPFIFEHKKSSLYLSKISQIDNNFRRVVYMQCRYSSNIYGKSHLKLVSLKVSIYHDSIQSVR